MELSIIIPVYNLENYIEDCLKSCLNQDIEDYEIICVDDGSKDNSPVILDRYAREYPGRIKVFHKENGGVSSARNYGIEQAVGKWIWFVDGDDWIAENCLKSLLMPGVENYDFIKFDAIECFTRDAKDMDFVIIDYKVLEKASLFETDQHRYDCMCTYLFKNEKLRKFNLSLEKGLKYLEDIQFILKFKMFCVNGLITNLKPYYYFQREDSAIHNINYENYRYCLKTLINTCLRRKKQQGIKFCIQKKD